MALVLAIEPDLRQATVLKRVIKEHVGAELTVVDSRDGALAAIAECVPDVILLTALLSPRDEEELFARLRSTPGAEHVQTHTIPQLASAAMAPAEERGGRGMFGKLRRKKADPEPIAGCDPQLFAEEVLTFLQRAAELKLAAASRPRDDIRTAQPHQSPSASDAPGERNHDEPAVAASAWASPFEWRPSSHENRASYAARHAPAPDAAAPATEPPPFVDVEGQIARAAQREAELAADRVRLDAERAAERLRIEAEREAEREKERARVEAEREAERLRVEAERERERIRVEAERQAERLRVDAERKKIEAERKKIEAERQREAAEREKERLRAEAERQRLEAEAAASRRREAERLREEAAKEKERLRKQAEEEKARLRAEAERKRIEAEREAERVRLEAAREAERLRVEAERQKRDAEKQRLEAAREAERLRVEAERQKRDAEKQRLEAERQKAAAELERERIRLEAARQKAEAERMKEEAERVRLAAEREAERLREEAQREAERLRAEAEEQAERARAEEAISAAKTQEEARQRREAEKARKRAAERARRHNQVMQDAFAEFRDDPVERPRGAVRLVPLALWARFDRTDASAQETERDELRELMKGLSVPPHVASVSYARGCRIRRVRVPASAQAAKGKGPSGPVILSRRALDEARTGGGTT
jgi:hypothetical protein